MKTNDLQYLKKYEHLFEALSDKLVSNLEAICKLYGITVECLKLFSGSGSGNGRGSRMLKDEYSEFKQQIL